MEFAALLRTHVPGLEIDRVEAIETGWDSFVAEVNGEWIFRFPRRPEVVSGLRMEARLLPELARVLPVEVPFFEVADFGERPFVGYRKLRGWTRRWRRAPMRQRSAGTREHSWAR